ncbi:hypothetical protein LA345_37915 (plasmid) [Burkholderia vietnamiensis]|uniref:Uncharacterized protein n=1 Tax=Burkholderia vietnamiensis (strain G4 / LMG 22486) TaxID=269482 RepID=A4JW44_BURVG|nr:hypothetical protein Bcep1808_7627 [Burkholderia vietnamiensis G4]MCB4349591.1 hypothetical protein [Burkholderia vietnamiensis]
MSTLRRFFIDYLMVPLGIPLVCAAASVYHVSKETTATGYATLAMAWPHLHQSTRDAIVSAMRGDGGRISQWEFVRLSDLALRDAGALELPIAGDDVSLQRERLVRTMTDTAPAGAILRATSFKCMPLQTVSALLDMRDNTAVQCSTMSDVADSTGRVLIARKAQLFGWKKGTSVEWTSWTTNDGIVVGEKVLHGVAFTSALQPTPDESLTVMALHDISVPSLAAPAN